MQKYGNQWGDNLIKGVNINVYTEIKYIQHVDDLSSAVENIQSIQKESVNIQIFGNYARSKINMTETQCILLGNKYKQIIGIKTTNAAKSYL